MIRTQFSLDLNAELIVDNFAGGGGASCGIEMALGRHVDHAINHDRFALGMHRINHPQTVHHCEDVFDIIPAVICGGRPVGLAHFSPDCKHFSKAKGGKPVDKRIRGLVLVMLRWAKYGARVMTMENVEEITTWGPLKRVFKGGKWGEYPDPEHKGRTWHAFLSILSVGIDPNHPDLPEILEVLGGTVTKEECVRGFGYMYQARQIRACDYGSPTIRKRLYMIARRDGREIVWPEQSHFAPAVAATNRKKPWQIIADCIEWSLPCPSIFLTKEEARAWRCKRPLARATRRRVAMGIDRHVLKSKRPFIVSLTHQGGDRIESIDEPTRTVTGAHRGEKAIVCPVITEHANASSPRSNPADEPLRTQCAQVKGGHFALVAGSMVQTGYGEREGQEPRVLDPQKPLGTVVAGGVKHAAVTATLVHTAHGEQDSKGKKRGRGDHGVEEPSPTVLASPDTALAAATMIKLHGDPETHPSSPATQPADTISAGGQHHGLVAVHVTKFYGEKKEGESRAQAPDEPLHTQPTENRFGVIAATLAVQTTGHTGSNPDEPLKTIATGGHHSLIAASVVRHFGKSGGQEVTAPAPTTTADGGGHSGVIATYLAQHNSGFNETPGHEATQPISAISSRGSQQQIVAASVVRHFGTSVGSEASEPIGAATTKNKTSVVAAAMTKYFGTDQDPHLDEPSHTVTTKDRFGLVQAPVVIHLTPEQIAGARRVAAFLRAHGVQFEGEFATVDGYVIVDIGMRMLTPRELFRAQGFAEGYVIDRAWIVDPQTGEVVEIRLTKEQQIRMCGNSVCPQVMAALIRANVPELAVWSKEERKLMEAMI